MKKKDLEKALRKAGYTLSGGIKHEKWDKPGCISIRLPSCNEVNEKLAKSILKQIK